MPNYAFSTYFTVLQAEDICKELSIDQCQEGKAFHTTVLFKAGLDCTRLNEFTSVLFAPVGSSVHERGSSCGYPGTEEL